MEWLMPVAVIAGFVSFLTFIAIRHELQMGVLRSGDPTKEDIEERIEKLREAYIVNMQRTVANYLVTIYQPEQEYQTALCHLLRYLTTLKDTTDKDQERSGTYTLPSSLRVLK